MYIIYQRYLINFGNYIILLDRSKFKHKIQIRVRTFEVDAQGIVNNIYYLKYIEIGRVEYRRNLGYNILKNGIFNDGLKVVVVHNEIDYRSFAYLDALLNVYTKISWIKNSSFCFEHLITENGTNRIVCTASGILVNIGKNNKAKNIDKKFVNEINNFEKKLIKLKVK